MQPSCFMMRHGGSERAEWLHAGDRMPGVALVEGGWAAKRGLHATGLIIDTPQGRLRLKP
jgi:hypothetical protein